MLLTFSLEHNVYKRRLDLEGKPIADPVKHEVGESESKDNSTSTELETQVDLRENQYRCYASELTYQQVKPFF